MSLYLCTVFCKASTTANKTAWNFKFFDKFGCRESFKGKILPNTISCKKKMLSKLVFKQFTYVYFMICASVERKLVPCQDIFIFWQKCCSFDEWLRLHPEVMQRIVHAQCSTVMHSRIQPCTNLCIIHILLILIYKTMARKVLRMVHPRKIVAFCENCFCHNLKTNKVKYIKVYIFRKGISRGIYLNSQIFG